MYWIQKQAPAGNWTDFLSTRTGTDSLDLEHLRKSLAWYRDTYPQDTYRIIKRTDVVVED